MAPTYGPVHAIVESVEDLSPNFRRIVFSGPDLNHLATEGPFYDQRIKLIFPAGDGRLPDLGDDPEWYQTWLALPDDERGLMRTYSIRELTRENDVTRLSVDFVLHLSPGGSGPAAEWAAGAEEGAELLIIAPRRGAESGGIEFNPGQAAEIVLLGDETAAPAIARILEDLREQDNPVRGTAYLEVPTTADRLDIAGPDTMAVRWLPREGADHGEELAAALGWHCTEEAPADDADAEDLVWETPAYSATGEEIGPAAPVTGTYYWIAGESGVVKRLRRFLVREVGVDRNQVAFMGYWRQGVAMRG
ncbi:siderophore-interacting protein [Corynebacterium halotolerans]|uniref:siderophore-interacting protein n=1 Tax=Corynebacterium halotolerans TaxID=225326 RepID=UPI003CEEA8C1